ncbi:MAG: hypothetical protein Q4A75_08830 [Peptostreptococcaceae bacterium]|nr:hypothetical protein [Peptostreptococcaceae bacterium]
MKNQEETLLFNEIDIRKDTIQLAQIAQITKYGKSDIIEWMRN